MAQERLQSNFHEEAKFLHPSLRSDPTRRPSYLTRKVKILTFLPLLKAMEWPKAGMGWPRAGMGWPKAGTGWPKAIT